MDHSDTISSNKSSEASQVESQGDEELFELVLTGQSKAYRCAQADCGKVFKFRSEMKRHVVVHFKDRPYLCTYPKCNKSFKRSDALDNHLKKHKIKVQFLCTIPGCDEVFSSKSSLNYHLLKHEGVKMFRCSYSGCSRTFLTQAHLKQHESAAVYHKRILQNSETSPKFNLSEHSDADTFLGPEEFLDPTYNLNDRDYSEFTDLEPSHKKVFSNQFQNESLNTLSEFIDKVNERSIGTTKTSDFSNNQGELYTDAIKKALTAFMDNLAYDKDISEDQNIYKTCLERSMSRNSNPMQSTANIDHFFNNHEKLLNQNK